MANQEDVKRLIRSVQKWNIWREEHSEIRPDLYHANLSGVDLYYANLSGADLSGADLRGADLYHANLSGADLSGADLNVTDLSVADLSVADLSVADLSVAGLSYANLSNANLSNANLRGANLRGANLSHADLSNANLSSANLSSANLSSANLGDANLSSANLGDANLGDANLSHANLRGANLSSANLSHANLSHANLGDVNVQQTRLYQTIFAWVDLSLVKELETVSHYGPSSVDINSMTLPHNEQTRLHFLRGVGFTETQIEYLPSLLTPRPIEYASLFISYAHQDETVAQRLYTDLRKKDVPCWFAKHDLRPGTLWTRGIEEAIHKQDKLLLILSHHAVASHWVQHEVETAWYKQITSGRETLFPIRLDNAILESETEWARRLRKHHIGDFTGWQDDAGYQEAFTALLRHLKVPQLPMK